MDDAAAVAAALPDARDTEDAADVDAVSARSSTDATDLRFASSSASSSSLTMLSNALVSAAMSISLTFSRDRETRRFTIPVDSVSMPFRNVCCARIYVRGVVLNEMIVGLGVAKKKKKKKGETNKTKQSIKPTLSS